MQIEEAAAEEIEEVDTIIVMKAVTMEAIKKAVIVAEAATVEVVATDVVVIAEVVEAAAVEVEAVIDPREKENQLIQIPISDSFT